MEDKAAKRRAWMRAYQRKWRAEHPEQAKATVEKYREQNRDRINLKSRQKHYMRPCKKASYRWISVEEFLPEPDAKNDHEGDVLVYVPPREGCRQSGFYLGKLRPIKADPEGKGNIFGRPTPGSEWTLWGWSYYEQPIPSHWMRLPKEPEGGEKNETV